MCVLVYVRVERERLFGQGHAEGQKHCVCVCVCVYVCAKRERERERERDLLAWATNRTNSGTNEAQDSKANPIHQLPNLLTHSYMCDY